MLSSALVSIGDHIASTNNENEKEKSFVVINTLHNATQYGTSPN